MTKYFFILLLLLVCISVASGQKTQKKHSKPVHSTPKKANVKVEIIAPNVVEFDSTAIIILDGNVIKYYLYQDLLSKNKVQVVNAIQPKEAIQKYGELARNGAIVANTIK